MSDKSSAAHFDRLVRDFEDAIAAESRNKARGLDDLPLFAPTPPRPTGSELKAEGMALADAAEGLQWKEAADAAIEQLARAGEPFTAEDVRAICGPPEHANAFGSRFLQAARRGLIRKVGYRNSTRPTLHAHPIAVWTGAKP